jgi:hypothetical protein
MAAASAGAVAAAAGVMPGAESCWSSDETRAGAAVSVAAELTEAKLSAYPETELPAITTHAMAKVQTATNTDTFRMTPSSREFPWVPPWLVTVKAECVEGLKGAGRQSQAG